MVMVVAPLALWVGAVGTTRYVDDNTCPATGSGTLANPYCRIQDAICIAASGDTVSVAPGTYLLYTTNLNYLSNNGQDFGGMMTEITITGS